MYKKNKVVALLLILFMVFIMLSGCAAETSKDDGEETEELEKEEPKEILKLTEEEKKILDEPYDTMLESGEYFDYDTAHDTIYRVYRKRDQYLDDDRVKIEEGEARFAKAILSKAQERREKEERQKYNTGITRNDLARAKDGMKGTYVRFKGKIIQVIEGETSTQYRMEVNNDFDQVILLDIPNDKLEYNILKNDIITVEGVSLGNVTYDTISSGQLTVPAVSVDNFLLMNN